MSQKKMKRSIHLRKEDNIENVEADINSNANYVPADEDLWGDIPVEEEDEDADPVEEKDEDAEPVEEEDDVTEPVKDETSGKSIQVWIYLSNDISMYL